MRLYAFISYKLLYDTSIVSGGGVIQCTVLLNHNCVMKLLKYLLFMYSIMGNSQMLLM